MKPTRILLLLLLLGSLAPIASHAQGRQFSSVCMRNVEKLDKKLADNFKDDTPPWLTREYREYILLSAQVFESCAETDGRAKRRLEITQSGLKDFDEMCSKSDGGCPPMAEVTSYNIYAGRSEKRYKQKQIDGAYRFLSFVKSELASMQSDPNYSADLGDIKGQPSSIGAGSASTPAPPAETSDPMCPGQNLEAANKEFAKIDEELAAYNKHVPQDSLAVTPALQAVLWGTSKEIAVIKKYCVNAAFQERLASLNAAYDSALKACRQVNNSPDTECVPILPDRRAFEKQLVQTSAPAASSSSGSSSIPAIPPNSGNGTKSACESSTGRGVCVAR